MVKRVKCIITVMIAMIVGIAFAAATPMEVSAASKTPAKVTITAAKSVDYNAVKITWKKAKNAKQYQVYRATSKNGKYTKVKTTKSAYWTNTKLTTGKKYYYKVRAVNGKKTGKFSAVKSAAPKLKKATNLKVAKQSYTSSKVTWSKVNGAKKYQIYRSTTNKSGSYRLIKTTSERTFENTKLTPGKKYYYKVRAYRTVNGKKQYSPYSAVKSITMPAKEVATQFTYTVSEKEEMTVENVIFNKDVTIQGDNGIIKFINCEFKGNVISKAKEGTKVMLLDGTTVDGQCILNNGIKEGTFETALPKFITQATINVKTIDCYGAVYLEGDGKIIFNGVEYEKADCQYFINSSMELVKYTGQNGQVFGVAQWWEKGEKQLMIVCE